MRGREILLGVSGGVAAFKAAALASRLVQAGAGVSVVMTPAATRFVGPTTFEALTGRTVHVDMFSPREHFQGEHIGLARRADVAVVAPATAQTLARLAAGMADDLLSATLLCFTGPVLLAPAMNCEMWSKASVQRNVARLREDGFELIGPGQGWLSCGQVGPGRMAEPEEILERIATVASDGSQDNGTTACES
ncbi:MAG: flavoprotein [Planctomycetaceae bacterium]|jgi:phosphopantothenoylcysteine decarboxylase/phosphopantothenate--cysteine ligase|nr:flavoprotein [Planctomycetaceae bacterium]